jgi:hypothetical protein
MSRKKSVVRKEGGNIISFFFILSFYSIPYVALLLHSLDTPNYVELLWAGD